MNDREDVIASIVVASYIFVALLTFGHSAANNKICEEAPHQSLTCNAVGGVAAGFLWPLYWSWAGFEALKDGDA